MTTPKTPAEFEARYGKSENGNFAIVDTIGVPHPYCIGAKHVAHASDHFGGMLGDAAIRDAEKKGVAKCEMRGCTLTYEGHERALLISCKTAMKTDDGKAAPELHAYLLAIKDRATEDGFAGFAFRKDYDGSVP